MSSDFFAKPISSYLPSDLKITKAQICGTAPDTKKKQKEKI